MKKTTEFENDETLLECGAMDVDTFVEKHFDYLYELHLSDMPYGTAKCHDGDPLNWLTDRYGV